MFRTLRKFLEQNFRKIIGFLIGENNSQENIQKKLQKTPKKLFRKNLIQSFRIMVPLIYGLF